MPFLEESYQGIDIPFVGMDGNTIHFHAAKQLADGAFRLESCIEERIPDGSIARIDGHGLSGFRIHEIDQAHVREVPLQGIYQMDGNGVVAPRQRSHGLFIAIIHEVADQHHDGATVHDVKQVVQGDGNIGAPRNGLVRKQVPDYPEYVLAAFLRRYEQLNRVGKQQQTHFVVVLDGTECNHRADFSSHLPLEQIGRPEITGAGYIHGEHDRLLTFFFEDLDEGLVIAGAHIPVDAPDVITELIRSDFGEFHALALESRMVLPAEDVAYKTLRADFDLPDFSEEFLWDHVADTTDWNVRSLCEVRRERRDVHAHAQQIWDARCPDSQDRFRYPCDVFYSPPTPHAMSANIGILVFPGSNCDHDAYHVAKHVMGQDARFIWHKEASIGDVDLVIVPGGFSYGDYLRSGSIARFSPVMKDVVRFANNGGLVMGICNGFQILCEAHLLPGALTRNASLRFACKDVHVRTENTRTPFTSALAEGEVLRVPIAHGEGNYIAHPDVLEELEANGQVVFRYASPDGVVGGDANPNGSMNDIAGIVNREGNVLGMMPHPERSSEAILGTPDGARIFQSILQSLSAVETA